MANNVYKEILKRAQAELSAEEQARLAEELAESVGSQNGVKRHSILELDGLGKEIWQSINVDAYLAEERDSWDG